MQRTGSEGVSTGEVTATEVDIQAADSRSLAATRFDPAQRSPGPALLLSPAMAVRRVYYATFARAMAAAGIPVLTYDYRGIGGSRAPGPLRRETATMRDWATLDMAGAIRAARESWPERPLVMLGHSAGGWLAGLCPEASKLDGLVMVASQSGHWRHWSGRHKARVWGAWHVGLPMATRLWGYAPGRLGLGQDVPPGVAREWAAWGRRRDFVGEEADYARLRMPVLAVRIADDHDYAPEAAVEALLARFPQDRLQRRVVAPSEVGKRIGHFGYFRESVAGALWPEMARAIRSLPAQHAP